MSGIYKIINLVNGKCYVGSAKDFNRRWNVHLRQLSKGTHHNIKLQNSYNVHGKDSFAFEILEKCEYEKDLIIDRENYWIAKLDSKANGYNIADASFGDTFTANPRKEEIRSKMSKSRKGRLLSEEWKLNLSNASKGIPKSEHHKLKISEGLRGFKHSDETKAILSSKHTGKTLSEETKAKMKESAKSRPKVSDETKAKLSLALSGKTRSASHSKAISEAKRKWVYEITLDGKILNETEAMSILGCTIVTIKNRALDDKYPNYIRKEYKRCQ